MLDFQDFFGCCWSGDVGRRRAAMIWRRRLVSMSRVEGSVFDPYHGAAVCDVGGGVAVEGVPEDEQAMAEQPEGDGPLHGFLDPLPSGGRSI